MYKYSEQQVTGELSTAMVPQYRNLIGTLHVLLMLITHHNAVDTSKEIIH